MESWHQKKKSKFSHGLSNLFHFPSFSNKKEKKKDGRESAVDQRFDSQRLAHLPPRELQERKDMKMGVRGWKVAH